MIALRSWIWFVLGLLLGLLPLHVYGDIMQSEIDHLKSLLNQAQCGTNKLDEETYRAIDLALADWYVEHPDEECSQ